eukprot:10249117-Ditylum_brightwellii.AAC.1
MANAKVESALNKKRKSSVQAVVTPEKKKIKMKTAEASAKHPCDASEDDLNNLSSQFSNVEVSEHDTTSNVMVSEHDTTVNKNLLVHQEQNLVQVDC